MPDDHQADQLGAYADRWLDGQINEPTTAEEATFARLQRVLGATPAASSTHPIAHQENPMLPTTSIQPPPMPTSIQHRSPAMAALARWQPAISFTIMLALIGGLLAIAWDRQVRNADPDSTANAILLDDATPATQGCTPPPPSASDERLLSASLDDWTPPVYWALQNADDEMAARAQETADAYRNCLAILGVYFEDGEPIPSEVRDFFSPRTRYMSLYEDLSADQQEAIDRFSCRPREADVLATFPILVNNQLLPSPMPIDQGVYQLGDGRYAIGTGRITSASLRNPDNPAVRDAFGVMTLVDVDGVFYVDEYFIALSGDPSLYSYGQMRGDCD